jgi:hypothetical protein
MASKKVTKKPAKKAAKKVAKNVAIKAKMYLPDTLAKRALKTGLEAKFLAKLQAELAKHKIDTKPVLKRVPPGDFRILDEIARLVALARAYGLVVIPGGHGTSETIVVIVCPAVPMPTQWANGD